MKKIISITIFMVFCLFAQMPLQANESFAGLVSINDKSKFKDPFSENIGYDKESSFNSDPAMLRSAPAGPGIGEETPISDGWSVLLLLSGMFVCYTYLKERKNQSIINNK
jgi:hypothetical protein